MARRPKAESSLPLVSRAAIDQVRPLLHLFDTASEMLASLHGGTRRTFSAESAAELIVIARDKLAADIRALGFKPTQLGEGMDIVPPPGAPLPDTAPAADTTPPLPLGEGGATTAPSEPHPLREGSEQPQADPGAGAATTDPAATLATDPDPAATTDANAGTDPDPAAAAA